MDVEAEEISDYINAMIRAITKGIRKGYSLSSPIKFEIGVVNFRESEGFLKAMIAGIGGKRSKEENARITFTVTDKSGVDFKKTDDRINRILDKLKKNDDLKKS